MEKNNLNGPSREISWQNKRQWATMISPKGCEKVRSSLHKPAKDFVKLQAGKGCVPQLGVAQPVLTDLWVTAWHWPHRRWNASYCRNTAWDAGTQPVGSWSQARHLTGRYITITHTKVNHNKAIQDFHFYIHPSCTQSLQIPRDSFVEFIGFESRTQSWPVQSGASACTISGHWWVLIHDSK